MNDLKISIITPNYNYSQYIGELLESIHSQKYDNFEHIIVDDGSTDNSVEVIQGYIKKYSGKIILIQQENRGQTNAINEGLRRASGDIIYWINSDDTICPDVFSSIVSFFLRHPNVKIVFGDIFIIDIQGNRIFKKRYLNYFDLFGKMFGFTSIMASNAVFFSREAFLATGYLDENLVCNMDGEFFSRLVQNREIKKLSITMANFRRQPFTKASLKYKNWNKVVKEEYQKELKQSYDLLSISKIIPYRYSNLVKIWVRIYRIALRTIFLHYFLETFEKLKYKIKI